MPYTYSSTHLLHNAYILSALYSYFRLSISDVEVAKAQIVHLEQRFQLRLETGHAGIPLPYSSMSSNLPVSGVPLQSASSVASVPSLAPFVAPSLQQHQEPPRMGVPHRNPNTAFGNSAAPSAAPTAAGFAGLPVQIQQQARQGQHHQQQQQALNVLLANLAPQAFASSALGQANLQAAIQATLLPAMTTQPQQQQQQQPSAQPKAQVPVLAPSQPAPAPLQQHQNPLALLLTNAMIPQHAACEAAGQQPLYQASLAWPQSQAQTLTSLSPQALSQILLASLQQKQQGVHGLPSLSVSPPTLPVQRPFSSLGAGMMPIAPNGGNAGAVAAAVSASHRISQIPEAASTAETKAEKTMKPSAPNQEKRTASNQEMSRSDSLRTKAEEEAGSALFGFLSALRKNHEEALSKAADEEEALKKTNAEETTNNTDAELDPKEANGAAAKSSNSFASATTNTDTDTKNAALEGAAMKGGKRSTFRTVSSLTDQPSSDASSASASTSKGDSSSDEPQGRAHRVNIKQIGAQFSLPKQCSDISAGIGEGDSPFCTSTSLAPPASVTDCSSGVKTDVSSRGSSENQSSIEGDSEKSSQDSSSRDNSSHGDGSDGSNKMDSTSSGTSSEDDEKDSRKTKVAARRKSHGAASGEPNAKKQKKVQISDFTSKNVADHNTRMAAMYSKMTTIMSPASSEKMDQ